MTVMTDQSQRVVASPGRAFLAIMWRDVLVTTRELPAFLAQVLLQPLFLIFVFGRVLTDLGYTSSNYADLLFPGMAALTVMLTALQSSAMSLVFEFGFTKEIEDRLLAPLPTSLVAIEKIVFAALRGLVAGIAIVPIGALVLGDIPWRSSGLLLLVVGLVLGALLGGAMGLTLGVLAPPTRIQIYFTLILTPLLFTGCSQYPWPSLDRLPWFQVVTAFNPLTYVSEASRAALVPDVPHINPWVSILALVVALGVFTWFGMRGFLRRAVD